MILSPLTVRVKFFIAHLLTLLDLLFYNLSLQHYFYIQLKLIMCKINKNYNKSWITHSFFDHFNAFIDSFDC